MCASVPSEYEGALQMLKLPVNWKPKVSLAQVAKQLQVLFLFPPRHLFQQPVFKNSCTVPIGKNVPISPLLASDTHRLLSFPWAAFCSREEQYSKGLLPDHLQTLALGSAKSGASVTV